MNIGRPTRIIEIEPTSIPIPETVPVEPGGVPNEPVPAPVEPPV